MTFSARWRRDAGAPTIDPDGLSTVLVCAAARALYGRSCEHPPPETARWFARGRSADGPDPVAWVVDHYGRDRFPVAVIGAPHGAAVHLAVALGAAWLPTTADLRSGRTQTSRWTVPVRPEGYRAFLSGALTPGGTVITTGGADPSGDVRREVDALAHGAGWTSYHVGYRRPAAFSAAVADLYRGWLRRAGKTGNRLVVESGRLTDPSQVRRAGLVPYWCPGSSRTDVAGVQEWIAGSEPFSDIQALPEPPGTVREDVATWAAWEAAVAFGRRHGVVDPQCRRAYPLGRVPHRHAASVLAGHPYDVPVPPTLTPSHAMFAFQDTDVTVTGARSPRPGPPAA
jgi:hypothetical protein